LRVGGVGDDAVGAGEPANAGHIKSRLVIVQSQRHVFALPSEAPVRHVIWAAARAVAAKGQVAGNDGGAAAFLDGAGAAQVVAVQGEQAVVGRVGVATDAHGRCPTMLTCIQ